MLVTTLLSKNLILDMSLFNVNNVHHRYQRSAGLLVIPLQWQSGEIADIASVEVWIMVTATSARNISIPRASVM